MENENKNKDSYTLDDVLIVSFCLTKGINLLNIVEDKPGHFQFVLSDPKRCAQLKIEYLNNVPAPARELFSQREMLISEIKSRTRSKENNYERR